MAVKLRLMRTGKKKQPSYRIVAADSRSPRDGRFLDILGFYRPQAEPSVIKVDEERALRWLANGAQPTDTVRRLLERAGVWERFVSSRKGSGSASAPSGPPAGSGAADEGAADEAADGAAPDEGAADGAADGAAADGSEA